MNCKEYECCALCPRDCLVNRNKGEMGFCKQDSNLYIAWAGLHFGEEPPITGKGGSGTIFITGCNLACSFCQNYQISQEGMGSAVDASLFSSICIKLEEAGAENINIVTGSHHSVAIAESLKEAKSDGLSIPILWNTSSYEKPSQIVHLSDYVDIWLPDLKTLDSTLSSKIFRAKNYPVVAREAILKMAELSPLKYASDENTYKEDEKLISGVIVRYLMLPNNVLDAENVIKWFSRNLRGGALLSIMTQYTPIEKDATKMRHGLNRYIDEEEDAILKELLYKYDVEDGFYQELVQDCAWLPNFGEIQPFSSSLARPIWHWRKGFV